MTSNPTRRSKGRRASEILDSQTVTRCDLRGIHTARWPFLSRLFIAVAAIGLRIAIRRGFAVVVTGRPASGKSFLLSRLSGATVALGPDEDRRALNVSDLPERGFFKIDEPQRFEHGSVASFLGTTGKTGRQFAIAAQNEEWLARMFRQYHRHHEACPVVWVRLY